MHRRYIAQTILNAFEMIAKRYPGDEGERSRRHFRRKAMNQMGGYSYQPNGNQECARRRLQIEAGQLKAENGLRSE